MKHTKEQLAWLWHASAGQRKRIVLSCATGLCSVAFSLGFIWTSKLVIDIATGTAAGSLVRMAIFTVLLLVAQLLCGMADTWLGSRMQVEGGNALRRRIFSRLLQSRWNGPERFHTGDMVNRIEQDTAVVVSLLTVVFPSALVTGVQLLASFVVFYMLDSSLPWLILGIVPLFLVIGRFYMKRMRRFTREIRHSDSRIQSVIQESLQHRTVIKTMEHDEEHLGKLDELQSTLRNQVIDRTRFSIVSRSIVAFAFSGGYLTAFLWGAVRLSTGSITFGTMTAFLQLVSKIQRPVLDLARTVPSIINGLTAIERLRELEELPAEEVGEKILFERTPSIVFANVTFSYGMDKPDVFANLNMEFKPGCSHAIMGETGRGKTTLIRLLLALVIPQQGRVFLREGDREVEVSPLTRGNFVYVPQGNTLFSGSIRDNLLMGNPKATEEEMRDALKIAVADFVFDLPAGMDTVLNEQGGGLSEGQVQRISIARGLLRPGRVLVLDEATSAVDPDTEKRLVENLRVYCKGKMVVFVTHHEALAEACDYKFSL